MEPTGEWWFLDRKHEFYFDFQTEKSYWSVLYKVPLYGMFLGQKYEEEKSIFSRLKIFILRALSCRVPL